MVSVTEKLGHSDIIVVGATEAGDGITDGNLDGILVRCNEGVEGMAVGVVDGMMDGACVGRVFPE